MQGDVTFILFYFIYLTRTFSLNRMSFNGCVKYFQNLLFRILLGFLHNTLIGLYTVSFEFCIGKGVQ